MSEPRWSIQAPREEGAPFLLYGGVMVGRLYGGAPVSEMLRLLNAEDADTLHQAREFARRWDGEDVSERLRALLALLAPAPDSGAEPVWRRLRTCVEAWPDCVPGEYNPACCRFPKSCSCTADPDETPEYLLEPRAEHEPDNPQGVWCCERHEREWRDRRAATARFLLTDEPVPDTGAEP